MPDSSGEMPHREPSSELSRNKYHRTVLTCAFESMASDTSMARVQYEQLLEMRTPEILLQDFSPDLRFLGAFGWARSRLKSLLPPEEFESLSNRQIAQSAMDRFRSVIYEVVSPPRQPDEDQNVESDEPWETASEENDAFVDAVAFLSPAEVDRKVLAEEMYFLENECDALIDKYHPIYPKELRDRFLQSDDCVDRLLGAYGIIRDKLRLTMSDEEFEAVPNAEIVAQAVRQYGETIEAAISTDTEPMAHRWT